MRWLFGTSVVVGLATLTFGLILVLTGSQTTGNPDNSTKLASALVTGGNATSEGIQVHGDWIIEVYDPDGTLVEKREFENALQQPGQALLGLLLQGARNTVKDSWEIWLGHNFIRRNLVSDTGTAIQGLNVNKSADSLLASYAEYAGRIHGPELNVQGHGSGITLSGSAILKEEDPDYYWEALIVAVKTTVNSIDTFSAGVSDYEFKDSFTLHQIQGDPIIVKEGQKVNVTVKISFD